MEQAKNYLQMQKLLRPEQVKHSEYQAALYLLSTDSELTDVAKRYISTEGINFSALKKATKGFDEPIRQAVDVAHNLFSYNSNCSVSPFDLSRMGYPMMDHVCNALFIAGDQYRVEVTQDKSGNWTLDLDSSRYEKNKQAQMFLESLSKEANLLEDMAIER